MIFGNRIGRAGIRGVALVALGMATSAYAIPIVDSHSGLLRGATGVTVLGNSYDVEFVKGLCGDLFTGCDDAGDFAFSDLVTVSAASQALLDQVFLDAGGHLFDSVPSTTYGCENAPTGFMAKCHVETPFSRLSIDGDELLIRYMNVENTGPEHVDPDDIARHSPGGGWLSASSDNSLLGNTVWARWTLSPTSVPEPSTLALLAGALAATLLGRRLTRCDSERTSG